MTKSFKIITKFIAVSGLFLAGSASAYADEIVNVSLWDKGTQAVIVATMAYAKQADLSQATMGVNLSAQTVKAGKITFNVTNDAKETIHEMLVIPLATDAGPIINEKEARIAEDTANALGEVPETDPGKTGSLTLDLAAGLYLVTCNIPGHYMNGMWSVLTVE
jgi:uncharacterized cupredoxin-like copper-binding protein